MRVCTACGQRVGEMCTRLWRTGARVQGIASTSAAPASCSPCSLVRDARRRRRAGGRATAPPTRRSAARQRGDRRDGVRYGVRSAHPAGHITAARRRGLGAHRRRGSLSRDGGTRHAAARRAPDRVCAAVAHGHRTTGRHPAGHLSPSRGDRLTHGDGERGRRARQAHHRGGDRPQARAVRSDARLPLRRGREVRGARPGQAARLGRVRAGDHRDAHAGLLGAARPLSGDDPGAPPVEQPAGRAEPRDRGRDRELQPRAGRSAQVFPRLAHRGRRPRVLRLSRARHPDRGGTSSVPARPAAEGGRVAPVRGRDRHRRLDVRPARDRRRREPHGAVQLRAQPAISPTSQRHGRRPLDAVRGPARG